MPLVLEEQDGQYYCLATVKGPSGATIDRLWLVDTGASMNLIPVAEARALGLPLVGRRPVQTVGKLLPNVPVVSAKVDAAGCGFIETTFYAIPESIYALGAEVVKLCGISIPARG